VVFSLAAKMELQVELSQLSLNEFLDADEAFLTNSSWGVLPVVGVAATVQNEDLASTELQQVGDGDVGRWTMDLRNAYWDLVEEETTN